MVWRDPKREEKSPLQIRGEFELNQRTMPMPLMLIKSQLI